MRKKRVVMITICWNATIRWPAIGRINRIGAIAWRTLCDCKRHQTAQNYQSRACKKSINELKLIFKRWIFHYSWFSVVSYSVLSAKMQTTATAFIQPIAQKASCNCKNYQHLDKHLQTLTGALMFTYKLQLEVVNTIKDIEKFLINAFSAKNARIVNFSSFFIYFYFKASSIFDFTSI